MFQPWWRESVVLTSKLNANNITTGGLVCETVRYEKCTNWHVSRSPLLLPLPFIKSVFINNLSLYVLKTLWKMFCHQSAKYVNLTLEISGTLYKHCFVRAVFFFTIFFTKVAREIVDIGNYWIWASACYIDTFLFAVHTDIKFMASTFWGHANHRVSNVLSGFSPTYQNFYCGTEAKAYVRYLIDVHCPRYLYVHFY